MLYFLCMGVLHFWVSDLGGYDMVFLGLLGALCNLVVKFTIQELS